MEGKSLTDLFRGRSQEQIDAFHNQMKGLMDEAGLPYSRRSMTYNSRLAQELAAWADTGENAQKLHDLLYRAYFVDNHNIGDVDLLVSLATDAGMDADSARKALEERQFESFVDDNWRLAAEYGITGVPSFVSNGLCVVGCQPYEVLMRFVNHLRELKRKGEI